MIYGSKLIPNFTGAILESMSDKFCKEINEAAYYKKETPTEVKTDFNSLNVDDSYEF